MADLKVFLFTALVAATIITVNSRAVNISNTWMLPEEGFPVFYRYFRDRISWNEADAVCQFHHANLVTVDTTSQYDAVRAYLKELDIASNVWIGLSRTGDKRNFTWRDFRTLSLSDYWQEAIPTGSDPLCVAMDPAADFRWHALSCGGPEVASFICELPVPVWAAGPQGCLLTELPSLTVLYIPEQSAVELTSDCGLGGTKRIACKGNTDREDMMRRLACTDSPDLLDDKTQSPLPTTVNQESTFVNTKTTKSWIWTSNTVDTGDYGLPTRHRRETDETVAPSSTGTTTDLSTGRLATKTTIAVHATTKAAEVTSTMENIVVTSVTTDTSSVEAETEATTPDANAQEEFPSAINQGQLFSIIENGTVFDIIELNTTEENKTTTTDKPTSTTPTAATTSQPVYTTVIYHKEPTENIVTTNKVPPTVVDSTKTSTNKVSINDLPTKNYDKTLSKEVEMYPIMTNSLVKLNRTNRKELPFSPGIMKPDDNINIDVDNSLSMETFKESSPHKTVEIRIHHPGQENATKSTLFVTTRRNDKTPSGGKKGSESDKIYASTIPSEDAQRTPEFTTESTEETTSDGKEINSEESMAAEPTTKPNRQRQLTRPQRRSFYPYFFSRVLG